MIRSPESFAAAFSAAAAADLMRPSIRALGLPADRLAHIITSDLRKTSGPALFPNMRAFVRTQVAVDRYRRTGMGDATADAVEAIGNLILGAAKIGSDYATMKITTDAQKRITDYQLQSQALANQALNLQAQNANVQAAIAEGLPQNIANTVASAQAGTTMISGIPVIPVAIGAGVLLLGGLYLLVRRR